MIPTTLIVVVKVLGALAVVIAIGAGVFVLAIKIGDAAEDSGRACRNQDILNSKLDQLLDHLGVPEDEGDRKEV